MRGSEQRRAAHPTRRQRVSSRKLGIAVVRPRGLLFLPQLLPPAHMGDNVGGAAQHSTSPAPLEQRMQRLNRMINSR